MTRARICGWCGGPDYGCSCRDEDVRSVRPRDPDAPGSLSLGTAVLIALAAVFVIGRVAFGQQSASAPVLADRQPPMLSAGHAGDYPREPRTSRAPLHVLLARVIANESSRTLRPAHDGGGTAGELDADARAIWQTTLAFAAWKGITPEAALRRLAPHVTATKAPKRARHALYASLPARGGDRPALWVDSEHGPWTSYGHNWVKLRANVAALIAGAAPRPCAGAPIAWGCHGSEQCNDVPRAMARGLVEVDCGPDARNRFWQLPPERALVLDASTASGGRR